MASAVLLANAARFYPFMADDAFISLRYARRLLDGYGLTWTDGERVEGYSNLLWILGCAFLGKLGIDLVWAARLLGVGATLVALGGVAGSFSRSSKLACVAALGLLALSAPMAVWSMGGLEQPLVAAWLALGTRELLRILEGENDAGLAADAEAGWRGRSVRAGLWFGLLALTRPDGVLFGAVAGATLVLADPRRTGLRRALRFFAPVAAMLAAQSAFRWLYYGELLPNTGRAKLGLSMMHGLRGAVDVWTGLAVLRGLFITAAAGAVLVWRVSRVRALALAGPMTAWLAYVALVGGDTFPAWRHFVPAIVLAAFLVGHGVHVALGMGRAARWVVALVLVNASLLMVHDQRQDARIGLARSERWEWDGEVVGRLLGAAFGDRRPLLALDPAGAVPFFSGLPAVDMLGLNDAFLAHHRPKDFGRTLAVGHELGNGAYVLGRRPDLVLFCLPEGSTRPCFRSGKEMIATDAFRAEYRLVLFEGTTPKVARSLVWVRHESERIGIQREDGRVVVPGFLLGSPPVVAGLTADGKLAAKVPPKQGVTLPGLRLSAGSWRAVLDVDAPTELRGRVVQSGLRERKPALPDVAWPDATPFPLTVDLAEATAIDVEIENRGSATVAVRSVVFERIGGTR